MKGVGMTHLIHVGNSMGVRIPRAIISQLGFKEDTPLEFKVTEEGLLITPVCQAREGWVEAFKAAKKRRKEPLLIDDDISNQFDSDEWEW
jgi:antitoxin MazE